MFANVKQGPIPVEAVSKEVCNTVFESQTLNESDYHTDDVISLNQGNSTVCNKCQWHHFKETSPMASHLTCSQKSVGTSLLFQSWETPMLEVLVPFDVTFCYCSDADRLFEWNKHLILPTIEWTVKSVWCSLARLILSLLNLVKVWFNEKNVLSSCVQLCTWTRIFDSLYHLNLDLWTDMG